MLLLRQLLDALKILNNDFDELLVHVLAPCQYLFEYLFLSNAVRVLPDLNLPALTCTLWGVVRAFGRCDFNHYTLEELLDPLA